MRASGIMFGSPIKTSAGDTAGGGPAHGQLRDASIPEGILNKSWILFSKVQADVAERWTEKALPEFYARHKEFAGVKAELEKADSEYFKRFSEFMAECRQEFFLRSLDVKSEQEAVAALVEKMPYNEGAAMAEVAKQKKEIYSAFQTELNKWYEGAYPETAEKGQEPKLACLVHSVVDRFVDAAAVVSTGSHVKNGKAIGGTLCASIDLCENPDVMLFPESYGVNHLKSLTGFFFMEFADHSALETGRGKIIDSLRHFVKDLNGLPEVGGRPGVIKALSEAAEGKRNAVALALVHDSDSGEVRMAAEITYDKKSNRLHVSEAGKEGSTGNYPLFSEWVRGNKGSFSAECASMLGHAAFKTVFQREMGAEYRRYLDHLTKTAETLVIECVDKRSNAAKKLGNAISERIGGALKGELEGPEGELTEHGRLWLERLKKRKFKNFMLLPHEGCGAFGAIEDLNGKAPGPDGNVSLGDGHEVEADIWMALVSSGGLALEEGGLVAPKLRDASAFAETSFAKERAKEENEKIMPSQLLFYLGEFNELKAFVKEHESEILEARGGEPFELMLAFNSFSKNKIFILETEKFGQ